MRLLILAAMTATPGVGTAKTMRRRYPAAMRGARYPRPREMEAATPPVNVYEGNGQLSVVIPIPGAHPNHIDVVVDATKLRLNADCKYPQENQHYVRRDWQVGSWRAEVELPQRVDPARARATLNLGVLVIMAPMSETGSGERRLSVE